MSMDDVAATADGTTITPAPSDAPPPEPAPETPAAPAAQPEAN